MICEYCNNIFKTEKSLYNHKRKSKYCLEKQNKCISCYGCEKSFINDNDYKIHILNCVKFLHKKIEELEQGNCQNNKILEEKIKELEEENRDIIYYQNQVENLKHIEKNLKEQIKDLQEQNKHLQDKLISKPTINNTTINNRIVNISVINLNDDKIKNTIENNYDINVVSEGQKGIANFAKKYLLTDENGILNYVCTDRSRKIFKYKNSSGIIEKDVNAEKLTNKIIENGLINKTSDIVDQYWTNEDDSINSDKVESITLKRMEINNIKFNNSVFKLANITSI